MKLTAEQRKSLKPETPGVAELQPILDILIAAETRRLDARGNNE